MKDFRGYRSYSPDLRSSKGGSIKHKYLGEINNRNQMVLKEIFAIEDRFTQGWKDKQKQRVFNSQSIYDFSGIYSRQRASPYPRASGGGVRSNSGRWDNFDYQTQIRDNLKLIQRSPQLNRFKTQSPTPLKIAKTHIRNKSYDPINGQEKQFNTPKVIFRALGSDGPDMFYANSLPKIY